ncbi:hypothetical protein SKAU_G00198970 [Synaphobranchus kaupii]|uniref:Uncharacterized protein n=1 Tax=Synaphobranchus kaupii TaxID=118154 RepID=A0A9Q1FFJ0_SYNKA|nr:hypothetical protein SKAU_G00198970 [Synaphobranchus kaupii]
MACERSRRRSRPEKRHRGRNRALTCACWKDLSLFLKREGRTKSQPRAKKASSPRRSGSLRKEVSLIIILGRRFRATGGEPRSPSSPLRTGYSSETTVPHPDPPGPSPRQTEPRPLHSLRRSRIPEPRCKEEFPVLSLWSPPPERWSIVPRLREAPSSPPQVPRKSKQSTSSAAGSLCLSAVESHRRPGTSRGLSEPVSPKKGVRGTNPFASLFAYEQASWPVIPTRAGFITAKAPAAREAAAGCINRRRVTLARPSRPPFPTPIPALTQPGQTVALSRAAGKPTDVNLYISTRSCLLLHCLHLFQGSCAGSELLSLVPTRHKQTAPARHRTDQRGYRASGLPEPGLAATLCLSHRFSPVTMATDITETERMQGSMQPL